MTKNTLEAYSVRHMRRITEGGLWELVYTGRGGVKKIEVMDYVITRDNTEYSSHILA